GIADVISGSGFPSGTSIVRVDVGNGDGTFKPAVATTLPGASGDLWGLAPGDFDRDGKLDLAVNHSGSLGPQVALLLGNGDGTFILPTDYTLAPGSQPTNTLLAAADLNGDGRTDLASIDDRLNIMAILLGRGDGTFSSAAITVLDPAAPTPPRLVA